MTGCRGCREYKKRIENLEEELALVRFELEDLRSKGYKSKKKRPPKDNQPPPFLRLKREALPAGG